MKRTVILIYFFLFLHVSRSSDSSTNLVGGASTRTAISSKGDLRNVVEIFEHEEVIGNQRSKSWANKSWQTSTTSSPPPSEIMPPEGHEWSSDWDNSDGWYYYRDGKRRRRWSRRIEPLSQPLSLKPAARYDRLLNFIINDYAFKGYGISVYKSLIFRNALGISFRLPISLNFGSLERRPFIPIASASFGLFHPLTVATYLNFSLPMELLRYAVWTIMFSISNLMTSLFLYAFGYGVDGANNQLKMPGLRYSTSISERLGVSFSWRWSSYRGFEKRFNFYHVYLPTLDWLLSNRQKHAGSLPSFLREKFASCGLAMSGPLPQWPFFSASAIFSLSGLYYKNGDFGQIAKRIIGFDGTRKKDLAGGRNSINSKRKSSNTEVQDTIITNRTNETLVDEDNNLPLRPL